MASFNKKKKKAALALFLVLIVCPRRNQEGLEGGCESLFEMGAVPALWDLELDFSGWFLFGADS